MKKTKLNKAVSDSITTLVQEGIDVNVKIDNGTLIKLAFFVIITTAIIISGNYALHLLKK